MRYVWQWLTIMVIALGLSACGGDGGGGEKDTVPPVITLKGDNPMVVAQGADFSDPGATATDNVDGTVAVSVSGSVDSATIGSYTLTYTAVDSAGNEASVTREVKVLGVEEPPPPLILCNDTVVLTFTSPASVSVQENQTDALTLQATDANPPISYAISGGDSSAFDVNATTGVVTFKNAPDYESNKTYYYFTATATDKCGNVATQEVNISIINVPENSADLYIRSVVYDNKRTATVEDDVLYLYFNAPIDIASLNADTGANFEINGTGAIGSAAAVAYDPTLFNRLKISLKQNGGTPSAVFDTNSTSIALRMNSIQDANHNYPKEQVETSVLKFNVLARVKTGQTQTYSPYDDGNLSRTIDRNYTRDDQNNIVIDHATGLVWQDDNESKTIELHPEDAIAYCKNLTLAGRSWRLPNIYELDSILDKGDTFPINPVFQNIDLSSSGWVPYYSSTKNLYYGGSTYLFTVLRPKSNYNPGADGYRGSGDVCGEIRPMNVRCVSSMND